MLVIPLDDAMSGTPQKIINQPDLITFYSKIGSGSFATVKRAVSNSLPFLARYSNFEEKKNDSSYFFFFIVVPK
jgi:hypothetical protein